MITLFVEENNPITPYFYNDVISNLPFRRLKCTCGMAGCLSLHAYYYRTLRISGDKLRFRICRVKCQCWGRTHALLLSSMVPYSQISLPDQVAIIDAYESQNPAATTLRQRIVMNYNLDGMSKGEGRYYISEKLKGAGCRQSILEDGAIEAILNAADGTPRLMNKYCNISMLPGDSSRADIITTDIVMQAINDCELG